MLICLCLFFFSFLDNTFGPHLLQLCNRALFECLALNLYCLRGEQGALTAVINNRIVSTLKSLARKQHLSFNFITNYQLCSKHPPTVSHSTEDHVSRGEPRCGELVDQYDDYETAGHSGAHPNHRRANPALCCPHSG